MSSKKRFHIDFGDYGILYALIIFWILLAIFNENFRGFAFYQNILRQASFNAICGIGMTFVIISGEFDLSVASQVALCSVILTLLLPILGIIPTVIVILIIGMVLGSINGVLYAKLKIPAFIVTLATQMGYRALAQLVNSSPVVVKNKVFTRMAISKFLGLPVPFIIMMIAAVIGTIVLRKTKFGRNVTAIGNSHQAAKISGINVPKMQILIYMVVGLFTAASAIMLTSYLGSSNYGMQEGLEFTVISAVVLGGTSLAGGKGSIFNTIIAAIFLVTIKSAMDAFGISSYYQRVIEGVILIFAFSITEIRAMINNALVRYRAQKELMAKLNSETL